MAAGLVTSAIRAGPERHRRHHRPRPAVAGTVFGTERRYPQSSVVHRELGSTSPTRPNVTATAGRTPREGVTRPPAVREMVWRVSGGLMPRKDPAPADERLDPVRWRRPGRGTLLRLVSAAVLLFTAAAVLWLQPTACVAPVTAPRSSGAAAPTTSAAGQAGITRAIPPGTVGVPVRLADPTALTVVRPGNRVDLLRIDGDRDRTVAVANAALVLEVTGADDPATGGLLLALGPDEAQRAVATTGRGFAIVIRPG
jgi:hypothetical protein